MEWEIGEVEPWRNDGRMLADIGEIGRFMTDVTFYGKDGKSKFTAAQVKRQIFLC